MTARTPVEVEPIARVLPMLSVPHLDREFDYLVSAEQSDDAQPDRGQVSRSTRSIRAWAIEWRCAMAKRIRSSASTREGVAFLRPQHLQTPAGLSVDSAKCISDPDRVTRYLGADAALLLAQVLLSTRKRDRPRPLPKTP